MNLKKYKVAIIDDHEAFRLGLEILINDMPNMEVVGDVSKKVELFDLFKTEQPDIVFMDLDLGEENGIDITREVLLKYPETLILAITSSDEIRNFKDMIEAGAVGFLLKNTNEKELEKALNEVVQGKMYFSKEFLMVARQLHIPKPKQYNIDISDREKDVLRLICQGFSNQEMATELKLSPHTVDSHRRSLLKKLNARNTAEMIMIAFKAGLLNAES